MLALVIVVLVLLALWALAAFVLVALRRISFHQAFFLLPLKLIYRIADRSRHSVGSQAPVIYAVLHRSPLDPALMLSLLPAETLHILDERSARSPWLEPWREMARTIAFNPRHVFVSRRLVRHLRGRGRLAVYFPDGIEKDMRAFRLYRAVSKIAVAADARIVAISVQGTHRLFGGHKVSALEAQTMAELVSRTAGGSTATALFERVAEADRN